MSRLDCAEAKAKKEGLDINFSDWRLAVESGTTKNGNSLQGVSEHFRTKGVDLESDTPFPTKLINDGWPSWDKIQVLPQAGNRLFGGSHSWVLGKDAMRDALNYSPLQIAISDNEYNWEADGVVQTPVSKTFSHAITLYWIDEEGKYYIHDTIGRQFKVLNKDYPIVACKSFRDLPDNWKTMSNNFVKILKKVDGSDVGFWIPALSETELKNLALAFNKPIATLPDGTTDWEKIVEGTFQLTK
jgi:hypothetical protein